MANNETVNNTRKSVNGLDNIGKDVYLKDYKGGEMK